MGQPKELEQGLYRPEFEKDNCGFGLITQMDNKPSHWLIETAIEALGNLTHRGAIGADGKTGDGCGLLMKKPDGFFRDIANELAVNNGINAKDEIFLYFIDCP